MLAPGTPRQASEHQNKNKAESIVNVMMSRLSYDVNTHIHARTHARTHAHTHTHTHTVDATNRALSKGGLDVLSLVRCSVKTKTRSNAAPCAFLQCKDRRGAQQQLDPSTR